MPEQSRRVMVLTLAALVYFASFPDDAQALVTPISTLLGLTTAVSPWFYGLAAVSIVAMTVVKVWSVRVKA